jgi:hypothetical protein
MWATTRAKKVLLHIAHILTGILLRVSYGGFADGLRIQEWKPFVVRRSWPEGFGSFLKPVRVREGVG